MKRGTIILLSIIGVLLLWVISGYNGLVSKDEGVKKAWGDVQAQYQRRADVFKNTLETVKGAAANEKDILTSITNARSGIDAAKADMSKATTPAELDAALQKAQNAAMSIRVTVEAYPQIRSTDAFLKFQDEISGTENRIATARTDYNAVVAAYNIAVRKFPTVIIAKILGFNGKDEFKAKESAQDAPEVKF